MLGRELLGEYQFETEFPFGLPDGNRNGKPIREMETSHIRNCMDIVRDVDDAWYELFETELKRRHFGE